MLKTIFLVLIAFGALHPAFPLVAQTPSASAPAESLAGSSSAALAFRHVTVVDVTNGQLRRDQTVLIVGNRIQAVGTTRTVRLPARARLVEARGKYLIPGLWDLHQHLWFILGVDSGFVEGFPLLIANGVTGIREAKLRLRGGHPIAWYQQVRREVLNGQRVGPPRQLFAVAFHSGGVRRRDSLLMCRFLAIDEGQQTTRFCGDTALQRLIDSVKAAGYDMIKMYELRAPDYFAVAAMARRAGLAFGGHAGSVSPIDAADSGVSIIDHVGEFSGELHTRCFDAIQATAESCRPVAEAFRRHNSWSVPTLYLMLSARYKWRYVQRAADEFWAGSPFRPGWLNRAVPTSIDSLVPADVRGRFPDAKTRFHCGSFTLRVAAQVGLPVAAGTDWPMDAGFSLHGELWTLVECGLSPLAALQAATLNPARMLGATDSMGTVARGKLADLVLLDANPLADITNTTTIRAVVADGRYFDRAALDQLLAQVRAHGRVVPDWVGNQR